MLTKNDVIKVILIWDFVIFLLTQSMFWSILLKLSKGEKGLNMMRIHMAGLFKRNVYIFYTPMSIFNYQSETFNSIIIKKYNHYLLSCSCYNIKILQHF